MKKQTTFKTLLVIGALAVLGACSEDKGGGSDHNKTASVPAGPQGVVEAQNNANVYCQFTQGSFTCFQKNPYNGQPQCQTEPRTYGDITSMCQQILSMQQSHMQFNCNVNPALERVYRENCQNTVGVPPGAAISNHSLKTILCEYSGYNGNLSILKSQIVLTFDGAVSQERSLILNANSSCFGDTKISYNPGKAGVADMVTITNEGLSQGMTFSQTGFAGEEVRLAARDYNGRSKFVIACRPQQSQFNKNIEVPQFTKLVCKGKANLLSARRERQEINEVFNYDTSLLDSEHTLASGLTIRIIGEGERADNARIEYTAEGVGLDHKAKSSAYVKTSSTFKARSGHRAVDVTCVPQ